MKKIKIKELIEKIEGEAELDFTIEDGRIEDVKINFGFYRGIEEILQGRDAWDALVITPRVCGICNHAHLIAAVRAIEDGYQNAGINLLLSEKAKKIRSFTLACELIQNHMKWFYMTIVPQLEAYLQIDNRQNHALKATYLSSTVTKALAIFAGQWPHSSYAIPGGVSCDPTHLDLMQAEALIDECIRFVEQVLIGMDMAQYLDISSVSQLHEVGGDLGRLMHLIGSSGMATLGQSYDRFIVFGESLLSSSGKSIATAVSKVDPRYVQESAQDESMAKAVTYKKRLYETGPLARGMVAKRPIIKSLHKRYKDALLTRIFARMHEVSLLLTESKRLLRELDLNEPSCTLDIDTRCADFEGTGIVEAARGSLIHQTEVSGGLIHRYEIITPTQWNLSHGSGDEHGIAVEAMIGSKSIQEATFIFRTFDVCSVCTTQ